MTTQPKSYLTPEDVVELAATQCALALRDLYRKVGLPQSDLKEGGLL